jgi:hypothetical protein
MTRRMKQSRFFVFLVFKLQADCLLVWLLARVLEEVVFESFVLELQVLGLGVGLHGTFKVKRHLILQYVWCVFLRQIERVAVSLVYEFD